MIDRSVLAAVAALAFAAAQADQPPLAAPAHYAADGRLEFPAGYREWIFLTSGLDMNYRNLPGMMGHSMFDNVFVEPGAYRAFQATGTWPQGTMLVKEGRLATQKGSINKRGHYQSGAAMEVEVHLKDAARFPGGWAFFIFGDETPAAAVPPAADCYACHRAHGAVDTTFVQFYPTLIDVARAKGTVAESVAR